MIVCVCNNVSEKQVRQALASGMTTMAELRTNLDIGTCCGKCAACARKILRECQSADHASTGNSHRLHPVHFQPRALAA